MASTNKQDVELREQVRSIEQTQREVLLPKLDAMAEDVKNISNKDYITRVEADTKFMTKDDWAPYKWVIITFGGALLAALAAAVGRAILSGGLK